MRGTISTLLEAVGLVAVIVGGFIVGTGVGVIAAGLVAVVVGFIVEVD